MQLKRDDNDQNDVPQSGETSFEGEYYNNRPDMGGTVVGNPYGGPQPDPIPESPYGGPGAGPGQFGGPSAMPDRPGMPQYSQAPDTGVAVNRNRINPVFIIIGVLLVCFVVFLFIFMSEDYKPGKTSGNTYTNEYFGIKIHFDADYIVQGRVGSDRSEMHKLKSRKVLVTEVTAKYFNEENSLAFSVDYMGESLESKGKTEEDVIDEMNGEFLRELQDPTYDFSLEKETLTIGGKVCYGYMIDASANGVHMYCAQFYMFKGKYMAGITSFNTSKQKAREMITEHVTKYGGK